MYPRAYSLLLSLALLKAAFAQTPPNPTVQPKTDEETCTVSGTVFRKADGVPLKNASVQLLMDNDRDHAIATRSTLDGKFLLQNLPCEKYSMMVSRNGYVTSKYGQKKPSDPGTRFSLRPGQKMEGLVFYLDRAAVITGRLFDEDGEPMPGVTVTALRQGFLQDRKPSCPWRVDGGDCRKRAWAATTDQNGHYELRGLPPRRYKLYSWQDIEESSWDDPDVVKPYEDKGTPIELQDGDSKTADQTLINLKEAAPKGE